MKTFTIDAENNITAYASRNAARETGEGTFSSEEQLADVIGANGKRLIAIWNSLPGVAPVKKFTSAKVAVGRIWKRIQSLDAVPETVEAPAPAAKGKKAKRAKAAGTESGESKKARVIAMLQRPAGATLTEIMNLMGWQAHTVRGFMAGAMKKAGFRIESSKVNGERTYRAA